MTTAIQKIAPGYKQTEVGVIPVDWDTSPFVEIVEKYIDYRGRTPKKIGLDWGGGDILALSANNVQMGKIDLNKEAYFGSSELYKKWMVQGECEKDDVILTMEAPLGNVAQIPDDKKYILSQRVILIKPNNKLTKNYLAKLLAGSHFQNELLKNASGSTAQGIQRKKLDKIVLFFPTSLQEQSSIATALSDIDLLIKKLEKLIDKKKNIKQGAMQELLTGNRRLPGFSNKWGIKILGELFDVKDGTHRTPKYFDEGIPFYSVESVTRDDFKNTKYISIVEHKLLTKNFSIEEGDILMTRIGSIGDCKLITWKPDASFYVSLALLKPRNKQTSPYIYHFSKTSFFKKELEDRSLQWAVPKKINLGEISNVKIYLPVDPQEQIAIAAILSDMNSEIKRLESQLYKYQNIKQGMTQNLLTGKIRLI